MRCYSKLSILFTSLLCCHVVALADLPEAVIKRIAVQKSAFDSVLSGLTIAQHKLLLERYAALLPRSKDFLKIKINKNEFIKYLEKTFPTPNKREREDHDYNTEHQEVNVLLEKLKFDRKGYFESKDKLQLHFRCGKDEFLLPLNIVADPYYLELQLRGIRIPNPDTEPGTCLRVKFDADFSKVMQIAWLSSRNYACPIPAERGGSCMLSVADKLSEILGARSIQLEDNAKAQCPVNGQEVSLTLLRIFQKGEGWYESHGFRAVSSPNEAQSKKARLLDYTLDELKKILKIHKEGLDERISQLLEKRIIEYEKLHKGRKVPEFMKWLWDIDCADYTQLSDFFKYDQVLDFSKLFRSPKKLIKTLQK